MFRCGGGTHLDVTKSNTGTAEQQTKAAWQVSDIRAEVAELRARGIKIEDYDTPGLKTEDGIADIGLAWGRLDHRPRHERPRHPPDQGGVAE
jgi:hypothetical protein